MVMHLLDDATMHNRLDITNFTKKQLKLNIYWSARLVADLIQTSTKPRRL